MKSKDQIILENLYQKILFENLDSSNKEKIIHDIMNQLTAFTFVDDIEEKNMLINSLFLILEKIRDSEIKDIKFILNIILNKLKTL
jgi:hypothetical protein